MSNVRDKRSDAEACAVAFNEVFESATVATKVDGNTKEEVLAELVGLIRRAKRLSAKAAQEICDQLLERERVGTTALGRGCAIPHIKTDGHRRFMGAIGYCPEGVDFASLDGGPTHAVFLVVGPSSRAAEYVNLMTRLARAIQKDEFITFLASCRQEQDFVDLLVEMDG